MDKDEKFEKYRKSFNTGFNLSFAFSFIEFIFLITSVLFVAYSLSQEKLSQNSTGLTNKCCYPQPLCSAAASNHIISIPDSLNLSQNPPTKNPEIIKIGYVDNDTYNLEEYTLNIYSTNSLPPGGTPFPDENSSNNVGYTTPATNSVDIYISGLLSDWGTPRTIHQMVNLLNKALTVNPNSVIKSPRNSSTNLSAFLLLTSDSAVGRLQFTQIQKSVFINPNTRIKTDSKNLSIFDNFNTGKETLTYTKIRPTNKIVDLNEYVKSVKIQEGLCFEQFENDTENKGGSFNCPCVDPGFNESKGCGELKTVTSTREGEVEVTYEVNENGVEGFWKLNTTQGNVNFNKFEFFNDKESTVPTDEVRNFCRPSSHIQDSDNYVFETNFFSELDGGDFVETITGESSRGNEIGFEKIVTNNYIGKFYDGNFNFCTSNTDNFDPNRQLGDSIIYGGTERLPSFKDNTSAFYTTQNDIQDEVVSTNQPNYITETDGTDKVVILGFS